MSSIQMILIIGLMVIILLSSYYVSNYNSVQRLINIIPEVGSNTTVLMKKRSDLIFRLVGIVDSYGIHESNIHVKVADEFSGAVSLDQSRSAVERLASLRMTFPELKADNLYETLMQQLAHVETEIADRREQYNSTIRAYNTAISQFPANLLLLPFKFQIKNFLSDDILSDPRLNEESIESK
jgi:LemA protein